MVAILSLRLGKNCIAVFYGWMNANLFCFNLENCNFKDVFLTKLYQIWQGSLYVVLYVYKMTSSSE